MIASYCSDLLTVTHDEISLDTGLSPREAAQSKLPQFLKESGYQAYCDENGNWKFSEWTWDDTKTAIPAGRKTESVFVTGHSWEGIPIWSLISDAMADYAAEEEFTAAANAVNMLNRATEAAATAGISLPLCGPAGVFAGTGTNSGKLLFLPAELFIRALQSRGDNERSRFEGIWVNPVLSGLDAWRFTIAALYFALLYGRPAYENLNTDARKEDYLDKNHIPLTECISGQSPELLRAITHNIDQHGAISKKARTTKKTDSDAIIARETVNTSFSVPLPEAVPFSSRAITRPETLTSWQNHLKKLKRIRFIRKYQTILKISGAAIIAIAIFAGSMIHDSLDRPSTAGLSPDEVLEMYYDGINTLNTTLFDAARYKKAGSGWSNYISTLFVSSKMRENYESIHTWTPGQWLYLKDSTQASCFGVTNLNISQVHHTADESTDYQTVFYILQYSMGETLTVSRYTSMVTVSRVNKDFRVTGDITEEEEIPVDLKSFKADLAAAIDAAGDTDNQAVYVIDALKGAYPWIPSYTDAARGKEQLESGEYQ